MLGRDFPHLILVLIVPSKYRLMPLYIIYLINLILPYLVCILRTPYFLS